MATNPDHVGADVLGSIDPGAGGDEYVIADISAEGAWLSVRAEEAPMLTAWR